MLKKLTVAQRLGGAFAILGLGLVLIIALAFFELSAMKRDLDLLAKDRVPKIMLVKAVQDGVNQTARSLRNVILSAGGADFDKELASLQAARKSVSESLDRLKPMIRSEQGKALLQATGDAREAYRGVLEKVLAASRDGRRDEAVHLLFNDLRAVQKTYFASLEEMTRYQVRLIDESVTQAEASYQNAVWIIAVAAALILAVAGTAAGLTIRRITRQLGGEPDLAAQVAHAIAAGDLSTPIKLRADDRSSMLAAMQDMQRHLAEVVRKIQDEADRVSSTAEQLSVSSSQVADSSRQQSSAAASMAASVEELTVSIDHVAARADEAANISSRSGELSAQGSEVIHNAANEMHRIESSVRESAGIIEALEQRSDQISAVVNVIKDIADQTNLLALNAAIEAARAGESGRGFAVVADEVRKLSERTAQSTQEIAPMILQIQEGARQAVASMQSGVAQANRGVALASEAGNSIVGIKAEAERVVDAVDDISHSLKEQSSASAEIARNVETIAQMTEENSAAVTETSAAAHHLEQMAISLQQTVAHFRLA